MKDARLVLHPTDPDWIPDDINTIVDLLGRIRLIGETDGNDSHFLAGDSFLDLIAFMGCSPEVNLQPAENNDDHTTIDVLVETGTRFNHGNHTADPLCPDCGAALKNWKAILNGCAVLDTHCLLRCNNCHHDAQPWQFNWRRTAGFGRCFIEISNIFPKEAIPQQALFDHLETCSNTSWIHFYRY